MTKMCDALLNIPIETAEEAASVAQTLQILTQIIEVHYAQRMREETENALRV